MAFPEPDPPVPPVPLWLGAGGLIPFIVLTGAVWVVAPEYRPVAYDWLRTYAACILSFVGALHWGSAMVHPDMKPADRDLLMGWSVIPALVAWLSLLVHLRPGLVLMAAMFVIHYSMDRALVRRFRFPEWYVRLRGGLTLIVTACLAVTALR
jgi:hypothetical protein